MKITDPQVIEDGEKDLIEAVQGDLDLDAVRQILKDRLEASSLSSRGGQIVVHNNQIAFQLDFDIKLSGSLLFDREGNYIDDSRDDTRDNPILTDEMDPGGFDTQPDDTQPDDTQPDDTQPDDTSNNFLDELPLVETGLDETELDETGLDETGLDETELDETELDEETGLDETDLEQQDLNEEIIINLPEYDLEEDLEDNLEDGLKVEPEEKMELSDPEDLNILDPGADELLSIESDLLTEDTSMIEPKETDTQGLGNLDLENLDLDNDPLTQEDMLDNDINDILKESREFWDQKKDS